MIEGGVVWTKLEGWLRALRRRLPHNMRASTSGMWKRT